MKRLLAFILSLTLALSLWACGEKAPEPPVTAPPETSPAAPEEKESLARRLTGLYTLPVSHGDPMTAEVFTVGGVVVLEYAQYNQTDLIQAWAEEFWPLRTADLESTELQTLEGTRRQFSYQGKLDDYGAPGLPETLTLREGALVISDGITDMVLTRAPQGESCHNPPAFYRDFQNGLPIAPEAVGVWAFLGETWGALLELREDGSFRYTGKLRGEPLKVYAGAWEFQADESSLHFLGEQVGMARQSFEGTLRWAPDSSTACTFCDVGLTPMLPAGGDLTFTAANPGWCFPLSLHGAWKET